jgi:hypothetical protein
MSSMQLVNHSSNSFVKDFVLRNMTTIRHLLFILISLIGTSAMSQVYISVGASNAFRTGNEYSEGDSWLGDVKRSYTINERFFVDSYSLGVDIRKNKSNLMLDMVFNLEQLNVQSGTVISGGYQNGVKRWSDSYSYKVNYGYLGIRVSKQRAFNLHPKLDLCIGPLAQLQGNLFKREYDYSTTHLYTHSFYNHLTQTNNVYEESSSSTEEFNGMIISALSLRIGVTINTKLHFNRYQLNVYLNGGLGIMTRADLPSGADMWGKWIHGFLEPGIKCSYQLRQ